MTVRILQGDCRDVLKTLPDESVHCVVTSPPYYGLRDYGVPGQLGLEASPAEYLDTMTAIFADVARVLRADGTVWLNIGDSYAGNGGQSPQTGALFKGRARQRENICLSLRGKGEGLKPKDLMGMPWRLAFALQKAGWYLRQDIIWHKPNPMPESVTDRCTKAHEYVFMLAKSERYFYDGDAIREPYCEESLGRYASTMQSTAPTGRQPGGDIGRKKREEKIRDPNPLGRNKRSVWTVTTKPFAEAHFATFPPDLIEPCILAGCPAGGTVLDPFGGAGTTGLVADRHSRDAILIELNPEYAAMAERRIHGDAPLFAEVQRA